MGKRRNPCLRPGVIWLGLWKGLRAEGEKTMGAFWDSQAGGTERMCPGEKGVHVVVGEVKHVGSGRGGQSWD